MFASSSSTYHRSAEAAGYKFPSVLLLLTNGLVLGAGLRYAITRLFIHNTRQIETQHEQTIIDASKSEVESITLRHDNAIRRPIENDSTEEYDVSPKQFIVSIRGLKNHGQTCYCNSVLQALASLKPFYYHLESMKKSGNNIPLIDALRCTIQYVNGVAQKKKRTHNVFSSIIPFLSGKSSGDPKSVMDMVAKHHSQFRSRSNLGIAGTTEQQDSHEFLSALMDVLSMEERSMAHSQAKSSQEGLSLMHSQSIEDEAEEHLILKSKSATNNNRSTDTEDNELQEEKKHDDNTNMHHQQSNTERVNRGEGTTLYQHDNPFDGWLGSTIKCAKCLHIRPIRSSPFICLSLPIAAVRSEYLEDFLASEYGGFARAERVSDVQCIACAIKDKLEELEDEAMFLSGAIASMERRNRGKKEDQSGLKSELVNLNRHIAILKGMDADNDDEIQNHNEEDISLNIAGLVGLPKIIPMRGDAYKATLIMRPPRVLCIHVQRRHFDMASQRMVKISRRVHFPEVLDLSNYCAYAENSFEKDCTTKSKDWPKLPYKLMSVVEHKGSAFGGHYQTYRRVGADHKEWVLVSDESVVSRSWGDVQRCEAYMLLYEEWQRTSCQE